MRSFHLPTLPFEEEITLKEMEKHHKTSRTRKRATIVLMSSRGLDQTAIANALGISWPFVHETLKQYKEKGFLGLMEHHAGATATLRPEQVEQFIHWVDLGPKFYHYSFAQWTTRSLQWRLRAVWNAVLTREAIRQLLHRLGFRWKRPQATYARVDPEARARSQTELAQLFQEAKEGKILLLLQDEAITSLLTTVKDGWSRKGQQLRIPSLGYHQRCCIFAVVNPLTGDVHYRLFERINRENMKRFLRHLQRFYGNRSVPVWMVLDNHTAHKGDIPQLLEDAGIHPYYLAPYSGDLNGIERLWKWLRERNLHDTFFRSLQELKQAIREFFCYIAGVKEQVISRVA
jgi:transposase